MCLTVTPSGRSDVGAPEDIPRPSDRSQRTTAEARRHTTQHNTTHQVVSPQPRVCSPFNFQRTHCVVFGFLCVFEFGAAAGNSQSKATLHQDHRKKQGRSFCINHYKIYLEKLKKVKNKTQTIKQTKQQDTLLHRHCVKLKKKNPSAVFTVSIQCIR